MTVTYEAQHRRDQLQGQSITPRLKSDIMEFASVLPQDTSNEMQSCCKLAGMDKS